jgi:pimeloyl-ACP methyl ester carboxylesterase
MPVELRKSSDGRGRERRGARAAQIVLLVVCCLVAACGRGVTPVEEARYEGPALDRIPIVLVPGVSREVGAQLRGGTFMPFSALALRTDAEALANLGDPRFPADGRRPLEIPGRLDQALRQTEVRGLQSLLTHLIQAEGYLRGNPDRPRDKDYPENPEAARSDRARPASLFVLYYDWRRDLADSACILAQGIDRIRTRTGATRVHLIGHSLGGVLARYYVRYGGRDAMRDRDCPVGAGNPGAGVNAPGAAAIRRLVTLGAPHQGSGQAFRALLQDFNLFGFVGVGLRDAVSTMPLPWQLLPIAGADGRVSLLVGPAGEERVPLYAPQTWIERGWLVGDVTDPERRKFLEVMLDRAATLHRRMAEPSPAEDAVPRLAVGAACRPTTARGLMENGKVEFLSRADVGHPRFSQVTVPGDGIVSLESALGMPASPTLTTLTVCSSHSGYVDDPALRDRIVDFLLH